MVKTIVGIAVIAMGVFANAAESAMPKYAPNREITGAYDKADVNGKPYGGLDFCLTFVWNLMNAYPVVDVPAGFSSRNVPIGVQVIANTYDDLEAFRVASALSKTLPQNYRDGCFPDFRNRK